jgi:hypothetical protein
VVPVQSAREPRAQSELRVHARHTEIHHKPESVSEVLRILRQHLTELKLSDFADFRRLGRK